MIAEKERIIKVELKDFPIDKNSLGYAEEISKTEGFLGMVLFPDSFTKSKYEKAKYKTTVPSSAVIKTEGDKLYPQFRSRGINCGMMVIRTPFVENDIDSKKFIEFKDNLIKSISYGPLYYLAYRFRIPLFKKKFDLSKKELREVVEKGAEYIAEKNGVDKGIFKNMENGGRVHGLNLNEDIDLLNKKWFTRRTVRLTRSFGHYFGGNHFLEFQIVQENGLGLEKGQVVIMVHTGCQALEDLIRKDIRDSSIRKKEYLLASEGSETYEAFFKSQIGILNYVYAYRASFFMIVRDILLKMNMPEPGIIVEKGHNFVEKMNGRLIYRHNAEKLEDGEIAILSGSKESDSYIIRGGSKIYENYWSVDHGLGQLMKRNSSNNKILIEKGIESHSFNKGIFLLNKEVKRDLVRNDVQENYFSLMKGENFVSESVKLRPFLNIKYR